MTTLALTLAVLLSAAPQNAPAPVGKAPGAPKGHSATPFEGHLRYRAELMGAGPSRPGARSMGYLTMTLSKAGLRFESRFPNNSNTTLVTGNPPVARGWNPQAQRYLPVGARPQASRGPVRSELLGTETVMGLETIHGRVWEGTDMVEFWTAPSLVTQQQMDWLSASSPSMSEGTITELVKMGAWGPVVRTVRNNSIIQLEKVERTRVDPAAFTDAVPPAAPTGPPRK